MRISGLQRIFSTHKILRVFFIQSLNRSFKFSETKRLYELNSVHTLKESQQYYYALIQLKLESHSKPSPGTKENPLKLDSFEPAELTEEIFKKLRFLMAAALVFFSFYGNEIKYAEVQEVNTTFDDVRGIQECKAELQEIVTLIKDQEKCQSIGAKLPRGILLTGEPGTGKTLMARAIAGEAGVKFIACSGSEFDEVIVGVGSRRIRNLFEIAKKNSPAIIFIDEIDAVGGTRRGKFGPGLNRQTLNQLLVEMDGFTGRHRVIVIAATNIPEHLDEALKRPGRFDKIINVPKPDLKARQEIAELYLSKISKDSSVSSLKIAKGTMGFTGAQIANLINTAILGAMKAGRNICTDQDIEEARDRILLGIPYRSLTLTDKEKYFIALSEVGQALTIINSEGADPLHKTSILLRGERYGKTSQIPDKDLLNYTRQKAMTKLDVLISGKVIQDLALPEEDITDHSLYDVQDALKHATAFVMMGLFPDLFGFLYVEDRKDVGTWANCSIDSAVNTLIAQSYERVAENLRGSVDLAKEIAKVLVEKETLSKQEIDEIIENYSNGLITKDMR